VALAIAALDAVAADRVAAALTPSRRPPPTEPTGDRPNEQRGKRDEEIGHRFVPVVVSELATGSRDGACVRYGRAREWLLFVIPSPRP
jgi:hypothetical protein